MTRHLITWLNFRLSIASLAFSAISKASIFGWTLNVIPLSLGISTYSSISGLKHPKRFPFQKKETWPNLTVSLLSATNLDEKERFIQARTTNFKQKISSRDIINFGIQLKDGLESMFNNILSCI